MNDLSYINIKINCSFKAEKDKEKSISYLKKIINDDFKRNY